MWFRRNTERYPNQGWSDWYRFCKRTGQGDVEAARAWAEDHLRTAEGRPDLASPRVAGYFYWSIHDLEKAREALAQAAAIDPLESSILLHLALVDDELGDRTRRDEVLDRLWADHQGQAPRTNQACRVLRRWLAGGKGRPDLAFLDEQLQGLDFPIAITWSSSSAGSSPSMASRSWAVPISSG